MKTRFPGAEEYAAETPRFPSMSVVDVRAEQSRVAEPYSNVVLFGINQECLRLAVFEGEYRWHQHPDSDELFLVIAGELKIEFESAPEVTLTEWQSIVIPAGTVHRTRGIGRTVNLTCERLGARTIFRDADA